MYKFFLPILLGLLLVARTAQADTADDFLQAYFLIQDADAAEKGNDSSRAIDKYNSSLKILRKIKKDAPDWNPNIIDFRSKYCIDHITKLGGKVDESAAAATAAPPVKPAPSTPTPVTASPPTSSPTPEPSHTPPPSTTPTPAPVVAAVSPMDSQAAERITALEKDLKQARSDLKKLQDEKGDLEARLKKAEDDLRNTSQPGDERIQALLEENNSLKEKLSETEAKLKELPSNSGDIASLRTELANAQNEIERLKKENDDLRDSNESMKKDLESARAELKNAVAGGSAPNSDELQNLQKENALLRSIVDRQFQEDARRNSARDALSTELEELASRTDQIRAHIELLKTPLTPLSPEESALLKTPAATVRIASDDPNKLTGEVKAPRDDHGPAITPEKKAENSVLAGDAKKLFGKGDLEGAASKYEQILQSDPENIVALSNLGVIRFRQDRIEDAGKILKKALEVDSQDAFSLSVLGIVYYRQGKYDDAISSLTKAVAISPNNSESHNYLGITYSQKGYQEAAEKELLKAIELQPSYADAHFNLAVVYASANPPSVEMARKHYKKSLDLGMSKDSELEKLIAK